jgi:hypothetical protein
MRVTNPLSTCQITNSICKAVMTDVPKNSSIGLIPVFEASALLFFAFFGSSLWAGQIVIKARYESASASASVAKDESDVLFVEERMSSLSLLYVNPPCQVQIVLDLFIHEALLFFLLALLYLLRAMRRSLSNPNLLLLLPLNFVFRMMYRHVLQAGMAG